MKLCKDCKWCDLQATAQCLNPKNFKDETDLVYGKVGLAAKSRYCAAHRAYDGPFREYCGKAGHWFEPREGRR